MHNQTQGKCENRHRPDEILGYGISYMAVEQRNNRGAHTESSYHSRTWQCTTKHRVSVRTDIGPTRSLKTVYGGRKEKQPRSAHRLILSFTHVAMHYQTQGKCKNRHRPDEIIVDGIWQSNIETTWQRMGCEYISPQRFRSYAR